LLVFGYKNMPAGVYKRTEWHNKTTSLSMMGHKVSEEARKNMSLA